MSDLLEHIEEFFDTGGPLDGELRAFAPRPAQMTMARVVADAMAGGRHLAVEAGAGTGKTLAYLVPALLSGRKVIIATATRTLQDQLFHRDLPLLDRAIGRPAKVAQLKGRSNYLCVQRLARACEQPSRRGFDLRRDLERVTEWSRSTHYGDIGEVQGVEEGSDAWPLVTSTAENCLGYRCPDVERCHVLAARKRALESDLAVVNHHLLLADLALQDDGFGRLLPGAEVVIVDEAHRFPETAHALFDVTLSARQADELAADSVLEAQLVGAADERMRLITANLATALRGMAPAVRGNGDAVELREVPEQFVAAFDAARTAVDELREWLAEHAELSAGLARCRERAELMSATAARVAASEDGSDLCWVQAVRGHIAIHLTPIDASAQLRGLMQTQAFTWIFTSATLAISDDFSFFTSRVGVSPLDTCRIDSPFDYRDCARLFLPRGLPTPDSPGFINAVVGALDPLLKESEGRAFLLFTSRRALEQAAAQFAERNHGYTLLVQGRASRSRLLDEFVRVPKAVLLGTATFWEGVDIRGPALVVVAIDRLPFASPGDPFMQARLELVRRRGGDPFRDFQLPQAVLALRQGVGRLIRGHDDYGVVVICDPRLRTRGYGRVFLSSLPPIPVVESIDEAGAFLASREGRG
ncbi:MAG: ATP-dependent helicase [Nevskiales bacterium]